MSTAILGPNCIFTSADCSLHNKVEANSFYRTSHSDSYKRTHSLMYLFGNLFETEMDLNSMLKCFCK